MFSSERPSPASTSPESASQCPLRAHSLFLCSAVPGESVACKRALVLRTLTECVQENEVCIGRNSVLHQIICHGAKVSGQGREYFRSTAKETSCPRVRQLGRNHRREGELEAGDRKMVSYPRRLELPCLCCVPRCLRWPLHLADIYQIHDM